MFIFWGQQTTFNKFLGPAMRATLARFVCPNRSMSLICILHDRKESGMNHRGVLSDQCSINQDLKQSCVLAHTLFSLYLAAMINVAHPSHPES